MAKVKLDYLILSPVLLWTVLYSILAVKSRAPGLFIIMLIPLAIPHLLYLSASKRSSLPRVVWVIASAILVLMAIGAFFFLNMGGWIILYGPIGYLALGVIIWIGLVLYWLITKMLGIHSKRLEVDAP